MTYIMQTHPMPNGTVQRLARKKKIIGANVSIIAIFDTHTIGIRKLLSYINHSACFLLVS